ncbi:Hypothetical predicted protein, partial [Paramuricea clavata]
MSTKEPSQHGFGDLISNGGAVVSQNKPSSIIKALNEDEIHESRKNQHVLANKESRRPKSSMEIRNEKSSVPRSQRNIAWSQAGLEPIRNPAGKIKQRISRPTSAPANGSSSR